MDTLTITPFSFQRVISCLKRTVKNIIYCNYLERLMINGDEVKGDTSVPPYSNHNDDDDFDGDENWDREVSFLCSYFHNFFSKVFSGFLKIFHIPRMYDMRYQFCAHFILKSC